MSMVPITSQIQDTSQNNLYFSSVAEESTYNKLQNLKERLVHQYSGSYVRDWLSQTGIRMLSSFV